MYLEQRLSAICYKSTSTALGKQPWKIWVNKVNKSTTDVWYDHYLTHWGQDKIDAILQTFIKQ